MGFSKNPECVSSLVQCCISPCGSWEFPSQLVCVNCFSWSRIPGDIHCAINTGEVAKTPFVSLVAAQELTSILEKHKCWFKSSHPAQIHPFGWQVMGPPAPEPGEQPGVLPTLPLLPPVPVAAPRYVAPSRSILAEQLSCPELSPRLLNI